MLLTLLAYFLLYSSQLAIGHASLKFTFWANLSDPHALWVDCEAGVSLPLLVLSLSGTNCDAAIEDGGRGELSTTMQ